MAGPNALGSRAQELRPIKREHEHADARGLLSGYELSLERSFLAVALAPGGSQRCP